MSERNKRVVRRAFEEVYSQGQLEAIDEIVAPRFVAHSPSMEYWRPAGVKQFVAGLRAAFSGLHMTVHEQIAEGDKVVTRWTARGTHRGTFRGMPPTGESGSMTGIEIDRVVEGNTVECWTNADDPGLLQQLGAMQA